MKIGEFAKACGTRISVLRHYDKLGILRPVYIDRFTEYRYYDESQIVVFKQIGDLKAAGFSLSEIRSMLYSKNSERIAELFDSKQTKLEQTLHNLRNLRHTMSGGNFMEHKFEPFVENVNLPFVNDEQAVGKWEVLGEYHKNDDYSSFPIGGKKRELYFLPNGEDYWCYSWTKGKLIYNDGVNTFANDYRLEQRGDDLYMIVNFKSVEFPKTGETIAIALRKLDSRHYTKDQIAKKDDINKPFINDERVIGKWKAFSFTNRIEDFVPVKSHEDTYNYKNMYFSEIEFFENGRCTSVYGNEVISGDDMQVWTKGYVLRKWNSTACAYTIRTIENKDYLIIEWKSGDYRYGGMDTDYYAFVRDDTAL